MTETDDLIAVLESRGTSIKLLKITEEQVKYIENELPITLKLITNRMQIYQVFTKLFFPLCINDIKDCIQSDHTVFCAHPSSCMCFMPGTYSFRRQVGL